MNRARILRPALVCLSFVVLSLACRPTPEGRFQQELNDTGSPAFHAVRSERLQDIMRDVNRLTFERLPQEMDRAAMEKRRFREVAETATSLAADAERIPNALDGVLITQEHREVFNAFAMKLRDEALQLSKVAEQGDRRAINEGFETMLATCNACHNSFRILPRAERAD